MASTTPRNVAPVVELFAVPVPDPNERKPSLLSSRYERLPDLSPRAETADRSTSRLSRSKVDQARRTVQPLIMSRIDLAAAVSLPRQELVRQLEAWSANCWLSTGCS